MRECAVRLLTTSLRCLASFCVFVWPGSARTAPPARLLLHAWPSPDCMNNESTQELPGACCSHHSRFLVSNRTPHLPLLPHRRHEQGGHPGGAADVVRCGGEGIRGPTHEAAVPGGYWSVEHVHAHLSQAVVSFQRLWCRFDVCTVAVVRAAGHAQLRC